MLNINELKFDSNGLIPAIVQDYNSGQVLTLAYMNRASLAISLEEQYTCFFSRSRQELWRKGETSGNRQRILSITTDCDSDALVVRVQPEGPACHTGAGSCFFKPVYDAGEATPDFSLGQLYEMLLGRQTKKKEGSYTSYLFEKGEDKILKKVGEECTEVIVAAKNNDNSELIYELSDLAYHAMVLMVHKGITIKDVKNELAGRHIVDKKVKQEKMQ